LARSDLKRLASHSTDPPDDLVRKLEVLRQIPSQQALLKEQYLPHETKPEGGRRQKTTTWINSGIRQKTHYDGSLCKVPLAVQQYCFMHAVHQEVNEHLGYLSGDAHATPHRQRLYHDFYAGCRSPQRRELEPFSTAPHLQQQSGPFRPFQCARLMALIEITDVPFWQLPDAYDALLTRVRLQRQSETCDCQVLSEMVEQAIQRLVSYSRDGSWPHAGAQFLKLKGTETEREGQLADMVHKLVEAFEKLGVPQVMRYTAYRVTASPFVEYRTTAFFWLSPTAYRVLAHPSTASPRSEHWMYRATASICTRFRQECNRLAG
jgi:hypothetical protein